MRRNVSGLLLCVCETQYQRPSPDPKRRHIMEFSLSGLVKATHNGVLSFWACLIISSIRKPFSEHPATLIKPLCFSFILNVSCTRVARILVYNLSISELMVRGLQLSRLFVLFLQQDQTICLHRFGTLPGISQVLKRFESAIPFRSSAINFFR